MILRFARGALITTAALAFAACAEEPKQYVVDDESLAHTAEPISASDAISRAMQWVNAKLLYCQSPNHQHDYDAACPSTCTRTNNSAWDPYRSDCSGLISWSWGLPAPGRITSQFAPYKTDISHTIAPADLAPGDALNSTPDEHIILFVGWTTKGSEAKFIEEPGCAVNPDYAHEFTSKVTINANGTLHVSYTGMTFYPIRFASITGQGEWAASYVKQSWPLAAASPIELTAGEVKKGSIDLKNTGSKTWPKGVVKLAPIPRDKASGLAASTWLSPTRVSALAADVAPGQTGHFEWDLEGSKPGDYKPYFGLVADGQAWFADSGGPPDNDMQVNVHVVAASGGSSSGAGGSAGKAGAAGKGGTVGKGGGESIAAAGTGGGPVANGGADGGDTGGTADAGNETGDAEGASGTLTGQGGTGSKGRAEDSSNAADPSAVETGGARAVNDDEGAPSSGGCSLGARGASGDAAFGALGALAFVVARRRRREA